MKKSDVINNEFNKHEPIETTSQSKHEQNSSRNDSQSPKDFYIFYHRTKSESHRRHLNLTADNLNISQERF